MHRYEFQLRISPEEYLNYYRGIVRHVVVRAENGKTVQFPASLLQRFITPEGIHGRFALNCDQDHKHPELQKLQEPGQGLDWRC
jgi:hypothetical protein